MLWWVVLILFAASTVLSMLLQKRPTAAKSSALGDVSAPTAEDGRTIPVIFGTVKMLAPNVVWYGDLRSLAIKKGGWMTLGIKTTVGYKYFLGLWVALCHGPVDAVLGLCAGTHPDDKAVNLQSQTVFGSPEQYINIYMNDYDLFGGQDSEGGIGGWIHFYRGQPSQTSDSYLTSKLGVVAPPYPGLCHAVFIQPYLGTSAYLKNLSFLLRRCPSNLGLADNITNLGGDANPAEVIYEILTDVRWGLRELPTRVDLTSFRACANTLASEGMGISFQIDTARAAEDIIMDIERHIDAVLFTDPLTGLWTMVLARADYDPATLMEIDESDISDAPELSRGSWEETVNQIKCTYLDRATFTDATVQAQELANSTIRGEVVSETIDFSMFSNGGLAQRCAARELKSFSYPIMKGRLKSKRLAWKLRIGSPFALTWRPEGIIRMAMRVTSINYGTPTDSRIEVEFCEDVFYLAYTAYTTPPPSRWLNPVVAPLAPTAQVAIEAPLQLQINGSTSIPRVLVGAVRADSTSMSYEVWADEGAGYYQSSEQSMWLPSGTLAAPYPRTTAALDGAGFTLTGVRDLNELLGTDAAGRARGDCLLMFTDTGELCAWQAVEDNGDGTFTFSNIVRGVYDTLPADHASGARVIVLSDAGVLFVDDWKTDGLIGDSGDTIGV